ncbi:phenoloxidase-activating factor 3-like [Paramacrobiotus metropolitanus]|uniref:phenoloxidase-activating factor 3-like n=1 Tax=Paramacrobiotus metropolitanus TaxID=2943436 RepID=UPI0024457A22|nr:phenoloxidase-activating factor 3-like [Paramacrobiotus metropolitanus]
MGATFMTFCFVLAASTRINSQSIYGPSRLVYGPRFISDPYETRPDLTPPNLHYTFVNAVNRKNGSAYRSNARGYGVGLKNAHAGINYLDSPRYFRAPPYRPYLPEPSYTSPPYEVSAIIGPKCYPDYPKKSAHIAGFCLAQSAIDVCRKTNMTTSVSRDCNGFQYGDAVCCYANTTTTCNRNNSLLSTFQNSHTACVQEMQCGIPNNDPHLFIPIEKPRSSPYPKQKLPDLQQFVKAFLKQQQLVHRVPFSTETASLTTNNRIVGGFDAPNGSASICWQAAVKIQSADGLFFCGGVIIGTRTILTAGHCLTLPLGLMTSTGYNASAVTFTVTIGVTSRASRFNNISLYPSVVEGCARDYAVRDSIPHPGVDLYAFNNDIAMLILSEPIDFRLHSACACKLCLNTKMPEPGDRCVASGFGIETIIGADWNDTLPYPDPPRPNVPLKYVPQTVCTWDENPTGTTDLNLVLCGGGVPGEGTCFGDSGGPLFCYDHRTRTQYLAGLVSAGLGCGIGYGSLFTKVAPFLSWIAETAPLGDVSVMI